MIDAVYNRVPEADRYQIRGGWSMPVKRDDIGPGSPERYREQYFPGTTVYVLFDDYEGVCHLCRPSGNRVRAMRRRKKGYGVNPKRNYCSTVIG